MKQKKEHYKVGNWHGKPYNFFGDYLWDKFQCRVLKLPINAHLSCPNRDGTVSYRGCLFCSEDGSASPTTAGSRDILQQMEDARNSFRRSSHDTLYIAYFQAYTNTYAPVSILKEIYSAAVSFPGITGLMIGTRPDCLPDPVLDLIATYRKKNFELWLEIGMQTSLDRSLSYLNRGHTHQDTRMAIKKASERDIPVCVHSILGIPGETWDDMMATACEVSSLPVAGIKFHHMHVIKGTVLEEMFHRNEIKTISMKEYTSVLCDFIERLRGEIIIHRIVGDRDENTLIAPLWGHHKGTVLKAIEDEFHKRGTYQGFLT